MPKTDNLFLYAAMTVCSVIEGALTLSDQGLVTAEHLRSLFYFNGAFWPGLLDNWKPNYALQPYTMFVSHGFLHTGLSHLIVNMIALWVLGKSIVRKVGQGNFILLYIASTIGGGLGFALLADNLQPMVGASGALFGLLGAILTWEFKSRREDRAALIDFAKFVLLLIVLNFVYWWAMDGQLAWQAHLGGFLAGWLSALFVGRDLHNDNNWS